MSPHTSEVHMRYGLMRVAVVSVLLGVSSTASANPEPPALFDSRSVGMGGTGVAFIDSGGAVYHNPALLEGIRRFAVTVTASPVFPRATTPANGPNTEVDSAFAVAPLGFVGAGLRLTREVVLGLGAYLGSGLGYTYDDAGPTMTKQESILALGEVVLPISVRLVEGLSVGIAPRLVYANQTADVTVLMEQPAPTPVRFEDELSGVSLLALQAGVYYAYDRLRLGFMYRSRVDVELEGDSTVNGMELDAESEFSLPHSFRLGGAYEVLENELLVALDMRYQLYSDSNEDLRVTRSAGAMMLPDMVVQLDWRNTFSVAIGGEYMVTPMIPVRAGYQLAMQATPADRAGLFLPSPGISNQFFVGAGVKLGHVDIDAAAYYGWGGDDVEGSPNGPDGRYEFGNWVASLSGTYRL